VAPGSEAPERIKGSAHALTEYRQPLAEEGLGKRGRRAGDPSGGGLRLFSFGGLCAFLHGDHRFLPRFPPHPRTSPRWRPGPIRLSCGKIICGGAGSEFHRKPGSCPL